MTDMLHLHFIFDHIKVDSHINLRNDAARRLPLSLSSMAHWTEGVKFFTSRSSLNNYMILYTHSGCGLLEYRGKNILLKPGVFCIFDCREQHMYCTCGREPWELTWFHITGSVADSFCRLLNGNGCIGIHIPDPNLIADVYHRISQYCTAGTLADNIIISEELFGFLCTVAEYAEASCTNVAAQVEKNENSQSLPKNECSENHENYKIHENNENRECYENNDMHDYIKELMNVICSQKPINLMNYAAIAHMPYTKLEASFLKRFGKTPTGMMLHIAKEYIPEWIVKALHILDSDYVSENCLEKAYAAASVSRQHFSAFFRRYTGFSPIEYMNRNRVHKAENALRDAALPITDIAQSCGFSSCAAMNRQILKYTGRHQSDIYYKLDKFDKEFEGRKVNGNTQK